MSALRDCPGCGSFSMPYLSKRREGVWRAACDECGFAGPEDDTEAGAIAAWNRRATPAEVEKLRVRVERLEGVLRECANDLEAYVMREYSGDVLTPGNALRRARDLAPVDAARAALEDRNDD